MKLSIVVCAYNEEDYIESCLVALKRLRDVSTNFNVFIVDDGSEDRTVSITENFIHSNEMTYVQVVEIEHGGLSNARNKGLELSTGFDYVLFIDADAEIDQNYIVQLEKYVQFNENINVIGGNVVNHDNTGGESNILYHLYFKKYNQDQFVIGTNMIYKVSAIQGKKFFEIFTSRGDESSFMDYYASDFKVGYCADLIVYHHHVQSTRDYIRLRGKNGECLAITHDLFKQIGHESKGSERSYWISFSLLLLPLFPLHILIQSVRIFRDKTKWASILSKFGFHKTLWAYFVEYRATLARDYNFIAYLLKN